MKSRYTTTTTEKAAEKSSAPATGAGAAWQISFLRSLECHQLTRYVNVVYFPNEILAAQVRWGDKQAFGRATVHLEFSNTGVAACFSKSHPVCSVFSRKIWADLELLARAWPLVGSRPEVSFDSRRLSELGAYFFGLVSSEVWSFWRRCSLAT